MENPGRRNFLRSTLGALAGASALAMIPPAIRRALAVDAYAESGTINDIKHIVILMQENRSFNHYFGTLRGVRGFGDRFPIPLESGKDVWFQSDGSRDIAPYHLDSATTNALLIQDMPHNFADAQAAWNQGKFGRWPFFKTPRSMGYYRRADIPFQFALAESFTICDAYHCSITGSTDPNRIVFWSGSNFNPLLGRRGINCADTDSEPSNLRSFVTGGLPAPGYQYHGSAFNWPTLPELLEQAGISWRIYQNPNDNWNGLMHGGLAFEGFRKATADSGSGIYENGMRAWSIADLRKDVINETLPAVSWVLPAPWQSEHPVAGSSPAKGGNFISQVLEAATANSRSWSKTAMFVAFDENDGLFDHIPPPSVPSYNADGSLAGKSTVSLDGEYFSDPAGDHLDPRDTITGSIRPWGLGPRVPMYVVSPWSKGGWVNSQVFDHTSMGMFLEKRFGINVESISPWHRAVCGDLTSAFDFITPNDPVWPQLPDMSGYAAIEAKQLTLPAALPPSMPVALFQESGSRYSRALPYALHTSSRVESHGLVSLIFTNPGQQGAVFHVYDKLHLERIPRRYTVESGKVLNDSWDTGATDFGIYNLWVYGPNGYFRSFHGDALAHESAAFKPEVQICHDPISGKIFLKVHNSGTQTGQVTVKANALRNDGPWTINIPAGSVGTLDWELGGSGFWYDFTVNSDVFERRFAGRIETGKNGISDPAMAANLIA